MSKVQITLGEPPHIEPAPQTTYAFRSDVWVTIGQIVVCWDFFSPGPDGYVVVNKMGQTICKTRICNSAVLIVRGTDNEWYILVVDPTQEDRKAIVYDLELNPLTEIRFYRELVAFPNYLYRYDRSNSKPNRGYQLVYCPEDKSIIEHRSIKVDNLFNIVLIRPWIVISSDPVAIGDNIAIYYKLYNKIDPCCNYIELSGDMATKKYDPSLKIIATME